MKKRYLVGISLAMLLMASDLLQSNPTGAPAGRTGSPGDGGATCFTSGCHSGAPTDATGIITTNVPTEGYTPGSTYTVTVTLSGNGRKGFQVSPQKADGTLMGSLSAGSGSMVISSKYITHTSAKQTNPAVWTFSWTAPAAGSGAVDFYGAFAQTTSITKKEKITINEKTATGINENGFVSSLEVYPNPVVGRNLNMGFDLKKSGQVKIALIDITGREINRMVDGFESAGNKQYEFELPEMNRGIYFVQIQVNGERLSRKILVNN
ncbi:MAG: T9SS type A sorting domain-containing protein [Bacteroidetes bacterium]|nr:T9SS type A sorting domain-containing protein [Bacteroidota bacterium]